MFSLQILGSNGRRPFLASLFSSASTWMSVAEAFSPSLISRTATMNNALTTSFYASIVGCPQRCNGIVRDAESNIPRGFFTLAAPGDPIDLMLVAQNPGQPMGIEERRYAGLSAAAAAQSHVDFVRECFRGRGKTFHKRLLAWMQDLLGVDSADAVFRRVVYTNLVKCTTPNNNAPSGALFRQCYTQNFQREIRFWNPRRVVGLGSKTCDALRQLRVDCLPLPHPSHREDNLYHKEKLEAIRTLLLAGD